MNVTAKLTNWHLNRKPMYLVGYVSNDIGNKNRQAGDRFLDGDRIHTSLVVAFLEGGKYAKTMNSIYELDPPFVEKE